MASLFEKEPEQIPISVLFPDISSDRQRAVQETLDAYCELLLRIFERLESEGQTNFDDLERTS
jgi:hypothetical protein